VLGKTTDHRDDKQFLETKTLVPLSHESFENLLTINSPFTIQDESKIDFSRAPNVGEHTKEVLENMGYSDAELEDLKDGSSIYWPNKL
jgi:formyl-CoA transferase